MSKSFVLPAAIVVAALPATALAQSGPPTALPPAPPIYAPPASPAPPAPPWRTPGGPRIAVPGGPKGNPGAWFTYPDYPPEAKRAGEQGRVTILLSIDPTGRVIGCRVTSSSGSRALDEGTCRLAQLRGRFYRMLDVDGKALPYSWPMSARWVLRDEPDQPDGPLDFDLGDTTVDLARGPFARTLSVIVVDIDEEGVGASCRSGTPGVSTEVACADFTVGRQMMNPVLRNGKPVRATITLTRSIRIEGAGGPIAAP